MNFIPIEAVVLAGFGAVTSLRLDFLAAAFFAGSAVAAVPERKADQRSSLGGAGASCCFGDGHVGDFFDDPVEVGLAYGVEVGVGCGVHEVDGVGDAVFYSKFDGVEVVAECAAELERILFYAVEEFLVVGGRILHVAFVVRFARVVGHDVDLALADDVAAEVLVEVDGFLIEHAEVARLIVGAKNSWRLWMW